MPTDAPNGEIVIANGVGAELPRGGTLSPRRITKLLPGLVPRESPVSVDERGRPELPSVVSTSIDERFELPVSLPPRLDELCGFSRFSTSIIAITLL